MCVDGLVHPGALTMSTLETPSYASHLAPKAKRALRWPTHVAFAALLCVSACGKDDSSDNPGTAGTTAGASGSKAGTSGSAGTAGSTTTPPPQPVACGTATCNPPSNPLSGLLGAIPGGAAIAGLPTPVACCLEESSGKCGVAMSAGATCEAPAVADSRCPGIAAGALGGLGGGGNMVGCCIDNMCGQDGALFGRGCVENSQAKGMLSAIPLVGNLIMVPPTRACDAPPTTGEDAGVADAGI